MKSSLIIDELPTIYIRGLDNLIATARSNKVSVCLGFQDFSQLERDYGEKEAKVITNTVGNIFSGQVVGDTARTLSERFGKIVQLRESHSVSNENVTTSTNTQLETLIPASKISNLTQGMFVGSVADNFDERIEQKIFHAEIVIDNDKVKAETAAYVPIPEISSLSVRTARITWRRSSKRIITVSKPTLRSLSAGRSHVSKPIRISRNFTQEKP